MRIDSDKKKFIVLVGPPSVGKSTWIKTNFPNAYIINRDDLVEKVASSYGWNYDEMYTTPPENSQIGDYDEKFGTVIEAPEDFRWADKVFDKVLQANSEVKTLLIDRFKNAPLSESDVIADMTQMTKKEREMTLKSIEDIKDDYYKIAVDFKFKGFEDFIKKVSDNRAEAARRMGKFKTIPHSAFDRMFSSYEPPTKDEGFDEIVSVDNIENIKKSLNESGILRKLVRNIINEIYLNN